MSNNPLEAIKKYLYWNESIALADVMRLLHMGKTQSNEYFKLLKNELDHYIIKRGHRYTITKPLPFSFSVNAMLDELLIWKKTSLNEKFYLDCKNVFVDPLYSPKLNQPAIKNVISALNNNQALEISYVDAKLGSSAETRIIKPLALCFINERWHMHSYCFKREDARDFVLSRIKSSGKPFNLKFSGLAASIQDMQHLVSITIAVHPSLTKDQKEIVEREYKIQDDSKMITIPKHQAFYFRRKYIAKDNEGPPDKFLIEQ